MNRGDLELVSDSDLVKDSELGRSWGRSWYLYVYIEREREREKDASCTCRYIYYMLGRSRSSHGDVISRHTLDLMLIENSTSEISNCRRRVWVDRTHSMSSMTG